MAKKDHATAIWAEEMSQGWETALKSRLKFQGGLNVASVVECTGRSKRTVRKWFAMLVASKHARVSGNDPDVIRSTFFDLPAK